MKKSILFLFIILILVLPSQVSAERKIPILIYHSIDQFKGYGQKELYVTPENFEKQMAFLRDHGFTLLTFDRWEDRNKVNKPIFITFDDGYKNNLTAYFILKRLKTDHFNPSATFFIISDFTTRSNRLSKADLKMLADSGMISIQSHTATHPDLTGIENLEYELKASKEKIQSITGKPVIALAYPYGAYNDHVIDTTKKYYLFGLSTIPKMFEGKGMKNENYLLPRIYIKNSSTLEDFAEAVGIRRNVPMTRMK